MITISDKQVEDMRFNVQHAQDMYDSVREKQRGKDTPCEQLHYWDGKLAVYKEVQIRFNINLGVK
jgi:hypothetical protein